MRQDDGGTAGGAGRDEQKKDKQGDIHKQEMVTRGEMARMRVGTKCIRLVWGNARQPKNAQSYISSANREESDNNNNSSRRRRE